jgi:predicted GIY-YIG superfamily endonuclease
MGFFYAMQKDIIEFNHYTNAQGELVRTVKFFLDEFQNNTIINQLMKFYGNLYYCQYTSLMLEKLESNLEFESFKIISTRQINHMRQLMFMQISNREEIFNTSHMNINNQIVYEIWNDVFKIDEGESQWDLNIKINDEKPDLIQKNRNEDNHYLYIIKDIVTGYYKIGHTKNIKRRYKTLLSDRFSLIVQQAYELNDSNYAINLERNLHNYFQDKKNIGEWFDLSHLNESQLDDIIYEKAEELNYEIWDSNIDWSYDSRYKVENGQKDK